MTTSARRPEQAGGFADAPREGHGGTISDLGLQVEQADDRIIGRAELTPEMCIPGTDVVRTSVLAAWADTVTGLLAGLTVRPTITVTLDLELNLYRPLVCTGDVILEASVAKLGRQVTINRVQVTRDGEPAPIATGIASFMASPNPEHRAPEGGFLADRPQRRGRLDRPFAERAAIRRAGPGIAEVPLTLDNSNATATINGGLIALVAEEAVLACQPDAVLLTLSLRYLRAFRSGSARATAHLRDGLATVDIADVTNGRLGALATGRVENAAPLADSTGLG